jgi:DNA-binding transcriptional regulator YiaG
MKNGIYRYTESGLDTVFLVNGYEFKSAPGGKTVTFHDIDGLHRTIGIALVGKRARLTGKEFRFLRSELLLSQASLAKIIGVRELTVGRWEKGRSEIPLSADAIVRQLFAESIGKNGSIKELLERIGGMENDIDWTLTLEQSKRKWQLASRAHQAA